MSCCGKRKKNTKKLQFFCILIMVSRNRQFSLVKTMLFVNTTKCDKIEKTLKKYKKTVVFFVFFLRFPQQLIFLQFLIFFRLPDKRLRGQKGLRPKSAEVIFERS